MAQIIILGSSFAVPNQEHENTHLLIRTEERSVLVDCASNPMRHLPAAGVEFDEITDIILTHFHPDHVSGLPILLMGMWLLGRKAPVNVYGLAQTNERAVQMMKLFDWDNWPGFYEVNFIDLPSMESTPVLSDTHIKIVSSPVRHLIPTIGIRVELLDESISMAYSCDTQPCEEVVRLAEDVDILIHESAGDSKGHTSAAQAGDIAQRAGAKSLYLIHYPTDSVIQSGLVDQAKKNFARDVFLAKDFDVLDLPRTV